MTADAEGVLVNSLHVNKALLSVLHRLFDSISHLVPQWLLDVLAAWHVGRPGCARALTVLAP